MCIGEPEEEMQRGDAGVEHDEPAETSHNDAAKHAHLMQYTPPGFKVASHQYRDKVTKQEVRSAVEVSERATPQPPPPHPPKKAKRRDPEKMQNNPPPSPHFLLLHFLLHLPAATRLELLSRCYVLPPTRS